MCLTQDDIDALLQNNIYSSPTARKIISGIGDDEKISLMRTVLAHLGSIDNWESKPKGFASAWILAEENNECKAMFLEFASAIIPQPLWLRYIIRPYYT